MWKSQQRSITPGTFPPPVKMPLSRLMNCSSARVFAKHFFLKGEKLLGSTLAVCLCVRACVVIFCCLFFPNLRQLRDAQKEQGSVRKRRPAGHSRQNCSHYSPLVCRGAKRLRLPSKVRGIPEHKRQVFLKVNRTSHLRSGTAHISAGTTQRKHGAPAAVSKPVPNQP